MFITFDNRMRKNLLLHILFLAVASILQAQTPEDAKKWYLEGRFEKAKPIFEIAYKANPDNALLNQWLGVCELYDNNFHAAEKHLSMAASNSIPEAHYYLGTLYAKKYQFSDANIQFQKYRRLKRRDKAALAKLEKAMEDAETIREFTRRTEDVQIIDSMVVAKNEFLSAYHLSPTSGTIALPESWLLKNISSVPLPVFLNERKDKIYFSRTDSLNGFDLYSMEKLLDNFGNEKRLSEVVNDTGDQAYPFVMPDGLTLYFASTGDESIGGYDLFVTRYHLASDSYLKPNHLNAPFNSPFNDYMMVIDEEKGIGWFASDRFQTQDSVCVYTFIPNNKVHLLETDKEDYLIRRAGIRSIRDSWRKEVDYTSVLSRNKTTTVQGGEVEADFTFVINDDFTYHQLTDFKSFMAKERFLQYRQAQKEKMLIQDQLRQKRTHYARANENEKTDMYQPLFILEKQAEQLFLKTAQFAKEARNEEIRYNNWWK